MAASPRSDVAARGSYCFRGPRRITALAISYFGFSSFGASLSLSPFFGAVGFDVDDAGDGDVLTLGRAPGRVEQQVTRQNRVAVCVLHLREPGRRQVGFQDRHDFQRALPLALLRPVTGGRRKNGERQPLL